MANVCLVTDPHFGIKNNSELFSDSQLRFFQKQLIPYLKNNNITELYVLGDIFDNRNSINTRIHNLVFDLFHDDLKDFNVTVLLGNHDIYFNTTVDVNSIKFLNEFKNVEVIDKPTIRTKNGIKEFWIPWVVNVPDFIKELQKKKADVCFGHFNFNTFNFNKSKLSDDGIDASVLSKTCKKLFTGHFHTRSSKTIDGCEINYIGAPYELTRIDMDDPKGFAILNTDDLSYKFIDNEVSMKFVKLTYPEKYNKSDIEGNNVDLYIQYGSDTDEKALEEYIQGIEDCNPATNVNPIIETKTFFNPDVDISKINLNSIPEFMQEYLNSLQDLENKDEVYEILLELYNECKTE
jgi:UDP-2,3-diacylglucosamine pyrophosphatase LpxH